MVKQVDNFRYERKFYITDMSANEVDSIIKLHPAIFKEIYYKRYVNNIYFDYDDFNFYFDNVDGVLYRIKYRIRWYGNLFGDVNNPILELKIKNGLLGRKKRYPLIPFKLDNGFDIELFKKLVKSSKIPTNIKENLFSLKPVLINRYARKYYLSIDKNFRITVDHGFSFFKVGNQNNYYLAYVHNNFDTILELKYNKEKDDFAEYISNNFPFRLTKSSKFIQGIEKLYVS